MLVSPLAYSGALVYIYTVRTLFAAPAALQAKKGGIANTRDSLMLSKKSLNGPMILQTGNLSGGTDSSTSSRGVPSLLPPPRVHAASAARLPSSTPADLEPSLVLAAGMTSKVSPTTAEDVETGRLTEEDSESVAARYSTDLTSTTSLTTTDSDVSGSSGSLSDEDGSVGNTYVAPSNGGSFALFPPPHSPNKPQITLLASLKPALPTMNGPPQMMYPYQQPLTGMQGGVPAHLQNMPGVVPPPPRVPKQPPPTEPCQTLYIRNLPETKAQTSLQNALKAVFSQYGDILDIRMKINIKLRGQAWVTFKEVESATKALKEVQGFPLSGRPMDVQYSRTTSDKVAEQDGPEALAAYKKRRLEDKENKKEPAPVDAAAVAAVYGPGYYYGAAMPEDLLPPNAILFIQNLPLETTEAILTALFKQFQGFKEVRLVPGKSDIAFVEYDTEVQATTARTTLNGYKITPEKDIKVTYAKK
ncbi:hypothetical protein HKX48_008655 [Thoreauomyces humboldtii]|nr:hypothetical protein HKX48_008655 [Thoreauomyces humboldtii]